MHARRGAALGGGALMAAGIHTAGGAPGHHGTFELDGGSWEVDNNIWIVGDDNEVVVFDAAHDAAAIVGRRRRPHGSWRWSAPTGTTTTSPPRSRWRTASRIPVLLHPDDGAVAGVYDDRNYLPLGDGDLFAVAGTALRACHTPGHSPGSVCLPPPGPGRRCSPATPCSRAGRGPPAGRSATSRRSWSRSGPGC